MRNRLRLPSILLISMAFFAVEGLEVPVAERRRDAVIDEADLPDGLERQRRRGRDPLRGIRR